jgi:hypothetical protein
MRDVSKPHLLVLSGAWPCLNGHTSAANVGVHQILTALAATKQFRLSFICVGETAVAPPPEASGDLDGLRGAGIVLLPPVAVPVTRLRAHPLAMARNLSMQRWEWVIRGYGHHRPLVDALGGSLPDAVLTMWSEFATALVGALPVPKFTYYGDLDYKNLEAQHEIAALELASRGLRPTPLQRAKNSAMVALVRRGHYGLLRKFARVWNVSKVDADEQGAGGVNASYVSNIWPTAGTRQGSPQRPGEVQTHPLKIVGSVGRMAATSNSFGLLTLSREILPRLKRRLEEGNFEIHLFGKPPPRGFIAPTLQDPHFKMRGFVDDLEAEMMSAPVFLIANNHDKYKAGHTRVLHAWSLGCCVVSFEDIRLAMPELVHGENVLLGRTADDVVELITRAGADAALRERIGGGGRRTLAEVFDPNRVARLMADDIVTSLQHH